MTRSRSARSPRTWMLSGVMWAVAVLFALPLLWMISASLKRNIDVFTLPVKWIPDPVQWVNYFNVWAGDPPLLRYFGNSVIVATVAVVGELFTSSLAGYAFARMRFKGRDRLFLLYIATSIVPTQLLLVPRFMFFQAVGLYDTLWALILPSMFTVFGTFLMRQHFSTVPGELAEAARLDGAGEWSIYWRIYLPMARPVLAALAILGFVWSWNSYETPLIMLSTDENYTLPVGLTRFVDGDGGLAGGLSMAAATSSVVPMIIVFLVFQRQFLSALSRTGLK
ncbi:carbohydrate ABC transporter permease [Sphaerisporangium rhizosphaerae]|uniref:Carbohydrate ABC transporter permease n=1 Tax=Sphaerisporangium rhizosphaerae TaxID=2269375 RepID=A0ABW2PBI9_9ACTN